MSSASDLTHNRNLARLLLKELTSQLKQEDATYSNFAVKIVGGDKPTFFSLDVPEVLTEPLFWPIVFEKQHITASDITSPWGIKGPLLLSFESAFHEHYGPTTPWIEEKVRKVVDYVALLARAFLAHPDPNAAAEDFYRSNKLLFSSASSVLDHLDWNRVRGIYGKKEAARFSLQMQTRAEAFPRRNRGPMAAARRGNTTGRETGELTEDVADPSDVAFIGPTQQDEQDKNQKKKQHQRKRRRY